MESWQRMLTLAELIAVLVEGFCAFLMEVAYTG